MANPRRFHPRTTWLVTTISVGLAILLGACASTEPPEPVCPETECPTLECPEPARYEDLWAESAHADVNAEAFTHWNDSDPLEIPVECAKCHSRPGFINYLGIDGSSTGLVDQPVEVGTTLTCYVCHNEIVGDLGSLVFPSGKKIRGLGFALPCVECHQGLASATTVNQVISAFDLPDEDTPSPDLTFVSSHAISGATPFGTDAGGAYEYLGKSYQGRFMRGGEFFSCLQCHDPHKLSLKTDTCGDCHTITAGVIQNIRVDTSDFDGDGDISEGIASEINTFQENLWAEIQSYAQTKLGAPIAYDPEVYPYFFLDTNQDGIADSNETKAENRFNAWTSRLLKAAYNYNYIINDPGAYAHNSDYILQVLYDSIADLSGDVTRLKRPPTTP